MVVFSKKPNVVVRTCALLLAHFITYQHVWEHHISGVLVISAALLTVPERPKASRVFILGMMLILGLPTPFGLLDHAKYSALLDPAIYWPRVYSYLIVLPKAIPTFAIFIMCLVDLSRHGFNTLGGIWHRFGLELKRGN